MFYLLTSSREDVIDTKPWWFQDVSKLILGSMTDGDDKDDPTSLLPMSPSPGLSTAATSATFPTPPAPERKSSSRRKRFTDRFK
jgi:hypothetical protein